jgi:hypothetical protein
LGRLKTGELRRGKLTGLATETAKACPSLTILDATRGGATLDRIEAARPRAVADLSRQFAYLGGESDQRLARNGI